MDTSDIRVHCKGVIDLGSGGLDMQLKPRPKKRSLISLATPIDIRGTLKDPEFRVQKKGLAKTGLRIYFWFVTVWEGLLRQQIPSYDFPAYMRVMNGEPP